MGAVGLEPEMALVFAQEASPKVSHIEETTAAQDAMKLSERAQIEILSREILDEPKIGFCNGCELANFHCFCEWRKTELLRGNGW